MDYIAEIQAAFLKLHGCDAVYLETVPVVEDSKGKQSGKVTLKCSSWRGIRKQHADTVGDT
jgi:hypothetical protein